MFSSCFFANADIARCEKDVLAFLTKRQHQQYVLRMSCAAEYLLNIYLYRCNTYPQMFPQTFAKILVLVKLRLFFCGRICLGEGTDFQSTDSFREKDELLSVIHIYTWSSIRLAVICQRRKKGI